MLKARHALELAEAENPRRSIELSSITMIDTNIWSQSINDTNNINGIFNNTIRSKYRDEHSLIESRIDFLANDHMRRFATSPYSSIAHRPRKLILKAASIRASSTATRRRHDLPLVIKWRDKYSTNQFSTLTVGLNRRTTNHRRIDQRRTIWFLYL